jgi:hypothetical protein
MRATYMYDAGDVRVIDVPDPAIKHPADAPSWVQALLSGPQTPSQPASA